MSVTAEGISRRSRQLTRLHSRETPSQNLLSGLLSGLVGGLVASWVMNQFQAGWNKLSQYRQQSQPQESRVETRLERRLEGGQPVATLPQAHPQQQEISTQEEPATLKTAAVIARQVLHRELTPDEKKVAEPLVHYVYGTLIGGVYGALAEVMPVAKLGAGSLYGTAVWLGGDEIALPLFGLAKPPNQYPLSSHVYALASHLVYGVTLEGVRRAIHKGLT
ncbi:MAG: DUF1440 domain-containing protein [Bacillota bacterium]